MQVITLSDCHSRIGFGTAGGGFLVNREASLMIKPGCASASGCEQRVQAMARHMSLFTCLLCITFGMRVFGINDERKGFGRHHRRSFMPFCLEKYRRKLGLFTGSFSGCVSYKSVHRAMESAVQKLYIVSEVKTSDKVY